MALISTTHFSAISLLPLQSGSWAYKACETEEDSCHSGHQPGNVDETEKENAGNDVGAAASSAASGTSPARTLAGSVGKV